MSDTTYSRKFPGTKGNHNFTMKFDKSRGGFIGITQTDNGVVTDRVLMTRAQFNALVDFVRPRKG